MPLIGWKSVSLKETNVKRLTKIAGKIQEKEGESVSLDRALECVLDHYEKVTI